ncbi:MAG: type II secretion system F family protein [archaeon]|jgi:flagellar protein FlaJ
MEVVPFLPLPFPAAKKVAKPFMGLGEKISKLFPSLALDLDQAEIDSSVDEYCSIMVFSFFTYFLLFWFVSALVLGKFVYASINFLTIQIPQSILVGLAIGLVIGFLIFIQMAAYPKIKIKKKVRKIDSNLIYALRTMLVQLKSGVSLFDSLCMIAYSKRYGELGNEIKKAVDNITSGMPQDQALAQLGDRNPSVYLKKVLWQIVNGMKAGADVSDILAESVSSITREQQIDIEKYGNSLRILSLMYLMIGVIIPALGLTFMIVIGSFPRIQITEITFWFFLGVILLSEFMFMGIMKSKRPSLMSN